MKLDEDEPETLLDCQRLFVAFSAFFPLHISRLGSLSLDLPAELCGWRMWEGALRKHHVFPSAYRHASTR